MNKKNIKQIMELIFIFILPLLFICFTSEIQVERQFDYDNNGNYETSQETKNLSFDNSIIKYNKNVIKKMAIQELLPIQQINENRYWVELQMNKLPNNFFINSEYNYEDPIIQIYGYNEISRDITLSVYIDDDLYLYINKQQNPTYEGNKIIASYQGDENNYSYFTNRNETFSQDFFQIYSSNYVDDYIYYEENVNTIWGNIKQLLVENLELNDNVLLDIVLCYTILWIIMFLIWHLLYGMFELIVHIIPRRE